MMTVNYHATVCIMSCDVHVTYRSPVSTWTHVRTMGTYFFRMAVLGHADTNFLSNGSSRPCRYEFFFQMAVLGHADMNFFSDGSSRPCRYDFFSENIKKI